MRPPIDVAPSELLHRERVVAPFLQPFLDADADPREAAEWIIRLGSP